MAEYNTRTNSGAAFVNNKKESERHPDMRGDLNVDGVMYWISVWNKTTSTGKPMLSFSIKKKEDRNDGGGGMPF